MPVELLTALPGSGKTEACIQRIRTTLSEHPLAQVWIVVPDRLQAASFRRRLAAAGGVLGGYVGTFRDLYRSILEQAGSYFPLASSPLLHRLVQEIVDQSVAIGEINHYAALQTSPGFLLALQDSFAELKRSLILPERFIEFTQNGSVAQQELALLYARYQARLRELNWADLEGLSWLAVEALERQPALAPPIRLVVIDGFDSFTGVRRRVLQLLASRVNDLLITFPGEPSSSRAAHRHFTPAIETLRQDLSPRMTILENSPHLPPDILQLENHIFETGSGSVRSAAAPFLLEARSPADEAREALRWIKACVMRENIPLTDCAIFTHSPDVYQPLLRASANEFGMPIHFTQTEGLKGSPAITALLNLLLLPTQNFKTRSLFNSLRSPYFDFTLDHQTVDVLETISRVACIVEGTDQWEETWERLAPSGLQTYEDLDEERRLPGLPRGAESQALRTSLTHFFTSLLPPDGLLTQTEWITWLEDLLESLHFYDNASSESDQLVCEALREALRALVLSETIIGLRRISYAQFLSDLQGTLDGVGLPEPFISGQAALTVGRMTEARGVRYKVVALLGLSEGIFPAIENPDPFLDEDLRQALGLEPLLLREQGSLFYQAVTRADQHLLITRPYLSEDGENWEPSPFWKATQSLFSETALQRIRPDDPRPLVDAASSQELLFWAVRRQGLPKRYIELQTRWESLRHARDILKARREKTAMGVYEGSVEAITTLLVERYSPEQVWSASRLEAYGACPHMFYITTALKLEAKSPAKLGLDANQAGTMLHKILEDVYRNAENPADLEAVLALLPQIGRQVFDCAPQEYGFRPSPLWNVEQALYLSALELTIRALAEEGTGWTPFAFEQTFGIKDTPPLLVDLGTETLRLHGVIDRLDRNDLGNIRVVDYKTGSSHLAQNDLIDGRRLQLPLYALAARDALGLGEVVDGIYWIIRAAKAGSLKLAGFRTDVAQGPEAAYQLVREHLLRIITGIRAANFSPATPKGGCPAYCPAAQWCWRFEPGAVKHA